MSAITEPRPEPLPPASAPPSPAAELAGSPVVSGRVQDQPVARRPRVASIDIFRGLVMFLMLVEMTELTHFAESFSGSPAWHFVHRHTSHVDWFGASLHDLIQPGFSFLVGCAIVFSIESRRRRGYSFGRMLGHAVLRSAILILLGIFLRSLGKTQTNFTFDDTLTQIGLGYVPLFFLAQLAKPLQYLSITAILIGYWAAFAMYPAPPADFPYASVGVPADWPHHREGFESHWNKNSNAAWAFDRWWMNLFPRERPWEFHPGGYATLSFIPTLATMLLGVLAGDWLKNIPRPGPRIARFAAAIAICFAISLVVDAAGWGPIVKRIWTPTWTLFSGAWCFAILLGLHWLCDLRGAVAWSKPVQVIGANSIAAYVLAWTFAPWMIENIQLHFGWAWAGLSHQAGLLIAGTLTLGTVWGILYWMYRRAILLRI